MINCTAQERELFKRSYKKQYFNKLILKRKNGEVISNEKIVGESFKVTERICSGSNLKFGLCEAKNIEIDCFDIENLKGEKIEVTLQKVALNTGEIKCTIPFGEFTITSCKKQGFDGRRKIIGYDSLKSSTLDTDMAEMVNENLEKSENFKAFSIYQIKKDMLNKYGIDKKEKEREAIEWFQSTTAENTWNSDTNKFVVTVYERYLESGFKGDEYYTFDIPPSLQISRREKTDELLKKYKLTFSGHNAFFLDRLCCLRLQEKDSKHTLYIYQNNETEYTKISGGTIFVTEKIEIRYGTLNSSEVIETLEFGYKDVLEQSKVYKIKLSNMEKARLEKNVESITLRNVLSSLYELQGEFGRINRITGKLESVKLNRGSLVPQDSLFPSESLFPYGGNSATKEDVSEVWLDENEPEFYGKIKLNYKTLGEDGKETEAVFEYVFDDGINKSYEVRDNWILNNIIMTEDEIKKIAEDMSENIKGISVQGFTAKMTGLPYLEAGDMIEIPNESTMTRVYILERTISGIQGLMDDMSALGGDS